MCAFSGRLRLLSGTEKGTRDKLLVGTWQVSRLSLFVCLFVCLLVCFSFGDLGYPKLVFFLLLHITAKTRGGLGTAMHHTC